MLIDTIKADLDAARRNRDAFAVRALTALFGEAQVNNPPLKGRACSQEQAPVDQP